MATNLRLTFLYPHLFKSIRVSEPTVRRCAPRANSVRFKTTVPRKQRFVERHGKAVEPLLASGEKKEDTKVFVPEKEEKAAKQDVKDEPPRAKPKSEQNKPPSSDVSSSAPLSQETQDAALLPGEASTVQPAPTVEPTPMQRAAANTADPNAPLESMLHMELPPDGPPSNPDLPHMHAPPYVHHFDSYTLVKQVEEGGFTAKQAVTSMKAVRSLLAWNLDMAREGLVSKSDVENETYLFRAACSELRTEVQNARKASDEQMRHERTLLQHEVDILNQKLTQELLSLKDDLQGMFNDRKMSVRQEQRSMDSSIQTLNYKITVALNSDSKSEVEGLRWILTRRSVLAIVFMALMVLSSLRFASYRAHEDELARKKEEKKREEDAKNHLQYGGNRERMTADGETQTVDELPAASAAEALAAN